MPSHPGESSAMRSAFRPSAGSWGDRGLRLVICFVAQDAIGNLPGNWHRDEHLTNTHDLREAID